MTTYQAATKGVAIDLLPALTSATGAGTAIAIPPGITKHKFRIITSVGVASGAVQPESADNPSYSGTWNPIGGGPITVPAASSELEYEFEGRFSAIRANVTTIIGGGTIQVQYSGV